MTVPCPAWWDTVSDPSAWMAMTAHRSRLRTGSPVVVRRLRSLRRVATTSPTWACSPPAIAADVGRVELADGEAGVLGRRR